MVSYTIERYLRIAARQCFVSLLSFNLGIISSMHFLPEILPFFKKSTLTLCIITIYLNVGTNQHTMCLLVISVILHFQIKLIKWLADICILFGKLDILTIDYNNYSCLHTTSFIILKLLAFKIVVLLFCLYSNIIFNHWNILCHQKHNKGS